MSAISDLAHAHFGHPQAHSPDGRLANLRRQAEIQRKQQRAEKRVATRLARRIGGRFAKGGAIPRVFLQFVFGRKTVAGLWFDEGGDDEFFEAYKKIDIPEDAYGSAILAFVRDLPEMVHGAASDTRELALMAWAMSMILLAMNLLLQCSMMWYVHRYVVLADVRVVQLRYNDFRMRAFDTQGEFRESLWEDYDDKNTLCQIAMWNRPFYYAVLFCWSLVMLIEIRKSEELLRQIWKVPRVGSTEDMLLTRGEDRFVVGLTTPTRFLVVGCVALPKMAISIILLWLGCEWLSATIQFESLVMNTVAMAFIVSIDEVLLEAIMPAQHRHDVEHIDILLPKHDVNDTHYWEAKRRSAFRKSSITIACTLFLIVAFAEYFQDVLPSDIHILREHCQTVVDNAHKPICDGWTWYLRGNPAARGSAECFPFRSDKRAKRSRKHRSLAARQPLGT